MPPKNSGGSTKFREDIKLFIGLPKQPLLELSEMSLFREARFIPESLLKSKGTTDITDEYSIIPAPCPTVFVKLQLPV